MCFHVSSRDPVFIQEEMLSRSGYLEYDFTGARTSASSGRQRKDNGRPAQTSGPATGYGIRLGKSAGAFNEDDVTKTIWLRHREDATHADGNEWAAGDSHCWQGFARSNSDFFWMSG
ncbi:hypothetical protein CH63R_07418 [Colletotrichum higginsianum IMI 349063]|uniref:Uncharacterized protein n=1 Tax=Colletotrichum higginsianum (strain IMI 349063) TaxID=759273 RepID=A0A1B7Y983_COLHI|nr:hypothetical protein CH63R_07418 [Colletotrichum higginsianum IMI 349063]OBR08653.1 hypothetical protein CH63R_07418 [Colletotrichum higginsianum IMI 349063]